MRKNLTNKLYVKKQLYGLQMKEGTNLLEHLNSYNMLNSQLVGFGVTLDEEDKAILLLASLPPSYDHLVTTVMYGKETLSLDEVTSTLLSHEKMRRDDNVDADQGLFVSKPQPSRGRSKSKGKGGSNRERSQSRGTSNTKKDVECHFCHKMGHYKNQCEDLKNLLAEAKKGKKKVECVSVAEDKSDNDIDTDLLSVSSVCKAIGISTVKIKMFDGVVRVLGNVRHVPEFRKNLISLGALDSAGCMYTAQGGAMKISRGALVLMKGQKKSSTDDTRLWHMRLDHMGERGMFGLHKRNLLKGVKVCKMDFCKYCVYGKQHRVWVYFLKHKSDLFATFKTWKAQVETQTWKKIKYFRTDNGTEYREKEFLAFCDSEGITRYYIVKKTPQQNGVAERMNRTLTERARCMRLNARLSKVFWAEAVNTACFLINKSPSSAIDFKIPQEVWSGKPVNLSDLRIFGCPAYVHVPDKERSKLDPKSRKCIFLGIWGPREKSVVEVELEEPGSFSDTDDVDHDPQQHEDPLSYKDATSSTDNDKWLVAMSEEMESLHKNKTWELVKLPKGKKAVRCNVLLAMVAMHDMELEQLDVKTAFLLGDLDEQIYMQQPEGFKEPDGSYVLLVLYVDDMLVAAKSKQEIGKLKSMLNSEFDMKDLGAAKKILGIEIHRDRRAGQLRLSQSGYLQKVLQRFNLQDSKSVSTPLAAHFKLSAKMSPSSEDEIKRMEEVPYANAVGCLMYLMVCTRPDISHAISVVSRYMANPGKEHWNAVKWVLRYLVGTRDLLIVFDQKEASEDVVDYVDSDYAGNLDSRRSMTGYAFMFSGDPVCWKSTL
ncbi:hypothetical protein Vadar_019987 [Vaccinium darrowii]|uniref:Uncharacterized protein n=1 Tax=Vaccinium darrowii TaxID=229202 RepID=A0ACB7Y934_9ERIC|nr:hypothetical protein Vadar_019987 [Vaccinium darrowii]